MLNKMIFTFVVRRLKSTLPKGRGKIPHNRKERVTSKSGSPHKPGGSFEWTSLTQYHNGTQPPGYFDNNLKRFIFIEDMVPELVVPDLEGFDLKPYVSYKVPDITQPKTLPEDIFNATYAKEIKEKYQKKLNFQAKDFK